jgi:hypothetical protein
MSKKRSVKRSFIELGNPQNTLLTNITELQDMIGLTSICSVILNHISIIRARLENNLTDLLYAKKVCEYAGLTVEICV